MPGGEELANHPARETDPYYGAAFATAIYGSFTERFDMLPGGLKVGATRRLHIVPHEFEAEIAWSKGSARDLTVFEDPCREPIRTDPSAMPGASHAARGDTQRSSMLPRVAQISAATLIAVGPCCAEGQDDRHAASGRTSGDTGPGNSLFPGVRKGSSVHGPRAA
jgi:hypothetical protein